MSIGSLVFKHGTSTVLTIGNDSVINTGSKEEILQLPCERSISHGQWKLSNTAPVAKRWALHKMDDSQGLLRTLYGGKAIQPFCGQATVITACLQRIIQSSGFEVRGWDWILSISVPKVYYERSYNSLLFLRSSLATRHEYLCFKLMEEFKRNSS